MLTSPRFYLLGMNSHLMVCLFSMLQVLNGLLTRSNQKEGVSIPIGIVPAGSDNSLVWTVLGVRDPISAALSIVKVLRPKILLVPALFNPATIINWLLLN